MAKVPQWGEVGRWRGGEKEPWMGKAEELDRRIFAFGLVARGGRRPW